MMVHGNESEAELRAIISTAAYDGGFEGVTLHPYNYEDYLGPGQWDGGRSSLMRPAVWGWRLAGGRPQLSVRFCAGKVVAAHPEFGRTTLVEAAGAGLDRSEERLFARRPDRCCRVVISSSR